MTTPITANDYESTKAELDRLLKYRSELAKVDMQNLTPDDFVKERKTRIDNSLAINECNSQLLNGITAEFARLLPKIREANDAVDKDLKALRRTADVLNAISKGMSTISNIITLIK